MSTIKSSKMRITYNRALNQKKEKQGWGQEEKRGRKKGEKEEEEVMFTLKKQQVKKAVGQLIVTIWKVNKKGIVRVFKIYQFDKLAKLFDYILNLFNDSYSTFFLEFIIFVQFSYIFTKVVCSELSFIQFSTYLPNIWI